VSITVRYHRSTAEDINDWLEGMAQGDPIRRAHAELYFLELAALLEQCGGPPPGAVREPGLSPPTYWWDYYPNLWIRFTIREGPKKWLGAFGERERKITVVRVRDCPPGLAR